MTQKLARRVRELREERGHSLAALAERSGVSRSMISVVERGEASPTAVVLERLAQGLGVVLADLFTFAEGAGASDGPLVRRADQVQWTDPASGYLRRSLTPPRAGQNLQLVEVQFPAKAKVAFEHAGRRERVEQQVWLLQGAMEITIGGERYRMRAGDCLAMRLDQPTTFHNPGRTAARYLVGLVRVEGRSA